MSRPRLRRDSVSELAPPRAKAAPPAKPPLQPPLFAPVFVDWVAGVTYLKESFYDKRIPPAVVKQHRQTTTVVEGDGRSKLVRIGRLTDPLHPAFGQHGLFAARKLAAGTHVCDYRGVVTLTEDESKTSEYTLAFVETGVRLTLDAEKSGNEGRFVNDFRGTGVGKKANVRFASYVDARGCTCMGVYAIRDLAKGEECLLSYGKGYWLARGLLHASAGAEAETDEAAEALSSLEIGPTGS